MIKMEEVNKWFDDYVNNKNVCFADLIKSVKINAIDSDIIHKKIFTIQDQSLLYNIIGLCYEFAFIYEHNIDKAIELYQQSANLGNSCAMFNLASLYFDRNNYSKAIEFYQQSATFGNTRAMNNLAVMYDNGQGVKQNYNKAIELYTQAIQLVEGSAMINLANMYQEGRGVPKNYNQALELYTAAAQLGNTEAIQQICVLTRNNPILFCAYLIQQIKSHHNLKKIYSDKKKKYIAKKYKPNNRGYQKVKLDFEKYI